MEGLGVNLEFKGHSSISVQSTDYSSPLAIGFKSTLNLQKYILSSVVAEPPEASDGGKAVPLTVMTFTESLDLTVCTALPA